MERRLGEAWTAHERRLNAFDDSQLNGPTDASGWTAKDHLAHLAAEAVYLQGDDDATNAVIQAAAKDLPLADVRALLQSTHEQLRSLVAAMNDDNLRQPYSHFLPDEPGRDDGRPIIERISTNGDAHYEEHIEYIEAIVAGS